MDTEIIQINSNYDFAIMVAQKAVLNGDLIVFPTDTVYGVGCFYKNIDAVKEIYHIKTRQFNKPLAVYFSDVDMVEDFVKDYSPTLQVLCEEFLPGQLTIITEKNRRISDIITSGQNTIGFRVPKSKFILDLVDEIGYPMVGTSANISNAPAAKTAKEAFKVFNTKLPYIFQDDTGASGVDSTIISVIKEKVKLIREGALPFEKIKNFLNI
ncbi:MAG: threonylcarbamoyl-AMP synthase [Ignavibacteria bacterium GWF2_33_9]|nr:MAG: threonylcarbamoyl-AMP synthase [Ignavibacteria bacterium GWF2_33_9]